MSIVARALSILLAATTLAGVLAPTTARADVVCDEVTRMCTIEDGGMAGLVGTGGAIRGMTLAAFDLRKDVFIATSAAIDMGIDLSRAAVYARNGYIHGHDLVWIPLLAMVAIAGTWIGKRLLSRMPQAIFRRTALVMVFGIGLVTLYQALGG